MIESYKLYQKIKSGLNGCDRSYDVGNNNNATMYLLILGSTTMYSPIKNCLKNH